MATLTFTAAEITSFVEVVDTAKLDMMIADAMAMAGLVAPCLHSNTLTDNQVAAFKAIIRQAVIRWIEVGTGVVTTEATGPFSVTMDTTKSRKGMFWPSEITGLQSVCANSVGTKAFSVTTEPATAGVYGIDYTWSTPTTKSYI